MYIKKLVCILLFLPMTIFAEWSGSGTVNNLRVFNGDTIFGDLIGPILKCGSSRFRFENSISKENALFSLLLTAQTTGKKVTLYQTTCEASTANGTYINGARIIN